MRNKTNVHTILVEKTPGKKKHGKLKGGRAILNF
jgi:hypothetical protein